MENKALAIVHFNPIELYPPVINLLNYIEQHVPLLPVYVFTNRANNTIPEYTTKQKNIIIKRYAAFGPDFPLLKRFKNYFTYYYQTYASLMKIRPHWLWYFETISALPAKWYFSHKKFQHTELLVHYHEYMSPDEYANGPLMIKWIHQAEKKLYKKVTFLSQTNEKRMQLFLQDNAISLKGKAHIFPNYPPKAWINTAQEQKKMALPVKIVYAGAIGLESLYIKEFCQWVNTQNGNVLFDIYSNQDTAALQEFLSGNALRFTRIKGYVPYQDLPMILSAYDVGVILYKGQIPNYVHNAPNKLFEYWACGLDVWFPEIMEGCLPFVTGHVYPKIIPVNFEELGKLDLESTIDRSALLYQPSVFYAEKILGDVLREALGISS